MSSIGSRARTMFTHVENFMHAEQRGSIGQAYSEAGAVTDDAPVSHSADAVLISTDSKEAGLWLWQGEAPPPGGRLHTGRPADQPGTSSPSSGAYCWPP